MYNKFVNVASLYYESKDWEQMGVKLPRNTLANWVNKCALDYLKPVYERLQQYLIERKLIYADETPAQVLNEDGRADKLL